MTDLNKERELELFNAFVQKELPELFEKHSNSNFFAKIIYDSMLGAWLGAKAQAVPVWISTDFMKPNDHDCVDILINDARRIVDAVYLDGKFFIFPPFSKEQWTEVNNKVTHWMHRVYVVSKSGAEG